MLIKLGDNSNAVSNKKIIHHSDKVGIDCAVLLTIILPFVMLSGGTAAAKLFEKVIFCKVIGEAPAFAELLTVKLILITPFGMA